MLDSFVEAFICLTAIFSTIFEMASKIEIGLSCSTFFGFVTLGNGATIIFFKFKGNLTGIYFFWKDITTLLLGSVGRRAFLP